MSEVSPADCLGEAMNTFRERSKVYGKNYLQHGKVMMALFPNGMELKTEEDWNRFGIINMIVSKLTRYSQSWPSAHIDSIHDLGVYAFMLESLDINDKMANSLTKELD
jgi:hypothetical protein